MITLSKHEAVYDRDYVERLEAEVTRLRSALAMIEDITGQDSVWDIAHKALAAARAAQEREEDREGYVAALGIWVESQELRDRFAAAALQGLLSGSPDADCGAAGYAADAYLYADAMLKAREEDSHE